MKSHWYETKHLISIISQIALVTIIFLCLSTIVVQLTSILNVWYVEKTTELLIPKRSPFIHSGDLVPMNTIKRGDTFYVNLNAQRNLDCRVEISMRLIKHKDGNEFHRDVIYSYPTSLTYSVGGQYESNEIYEVPKFLPPGKYNIARIVFFECNNAKKVNRWALIPIEIS